MDVTVPAEDTVEDAVANCTMSWDNKVTSFWKFKSPEEDSLGELKNGLILST